MKTTLVRTAVSGGALALTLGVAGPALACISGDVSGSVPATFTSDHAKTQSQGTPTESLADIQARLDAWLSAKLDRLAKVRARVEASTLLGDAQKAEVLARIDARTATLTTLRNEVAAATSIDEVKAALQAAFAPTADTSTLAEVQAAVDAKLARWLAWIDAKQAKLAANTAMDPSRRAEKLAKLQAWEAKLTALRAQIAADTSLAQVKADLAAAGFTGLMHHRGWAWGQGWDRGWLGARHDGHGKKHDLAAVRGKHSDGTGRMKGHHWGHGPSSWGSDDPSTRSVSVSWGSGDRGWGGSAHGHHSSHGHGSGSHRHG